MNTMMINFELAVASQSMTYRIEEQLKQCANRGRVEAAMMARHSPRDTPSRPLLMSLVRLFLSRVAAGRDDRTMRSDRIGRAWPPLGGAGAADSWYTLAKRSRT